MNFRSLMAYVLVLVLVLPAFTGAHQHLAVVTTHDQLETIDSVGSGAAAASVAWFGSSHEHGHVQHGEVDVDPPAKAFFKKIPGKALFTAILGCALLLLLVPAPTRLVGLLPPDRPPKWRTRFYLLPPSHAPPSAG